MKKLWQWLDRATVPGYWIMFVIMTIAAISNDNWAAAWFSLTTAFYATLANKAK